MISKKIFRIAFCAGLLISVISFSFAQVPDTLWTRVHYYDGTSGLQDIILCDDGSFVYCGFQAPGLTDYYTVHHIDEHANMIRYRNYGIGIGFSIIKTSDGGFATVGRMRRNDNWDMILLKINSNLQEEWRRFYGGEGIDEASFLTQAEDNGYLITGRTRSYGAGGDDIFVVRTDENGDTLWTYIFGFEYNDISFFCKQTLDGGFLVTGYSYPFGRWQYADIIKLDSEGNELWRNVYQVNGENTAAYEIVEMNNGDYLVSGRHLQRFSPDWELIWARPYFTWSLKQTQDGGFIMCNNYIHRNPWIQDYQIIRLDENGDTLWTNIYGGDSNEFCKTVLQTPDGGFLLGGGTESFGVRNSNSYLVRLESENSEELIIGLQTNRFELISTPLYLPALYAPYAFESLPALQIAYQDDGSIFLPELDLNTIGRIDLTEAYQVFCTEPSNWQLTGHKLGEATEYTLFAGRWNWLGYPLPEPLPVETALSEIEDEIVIVLNDDGGLWIPAIPLNTLGNLQPGEGYYIFTLHDLTFHYRT